MNRIASVSNPGPVETPASKSHRAEAPNHLKGSGEIPMVGNGELRELAAVLGMSPQATFPQIRSRAGWLAREHDRWRLTVADLVAQLEQARAQLDRPCGSCHPCDNWPAETWRRAGRSLPHVHEWDELRAEVDELRRARSVLASGVSLLADLDVELRSQRAALWELLKAQTRRLVECREDYWELSAECAALENEVADLRERRTDGGGAR